MSDLQRLAKALRPDYNAIAHRGRLTVWRHDSREELVIHHDGINYVILLLDDTRIKTKTITPDMIRYFMGDE